MQPVRRARRIARFLLVSIVLVPGFVPSSADAVIGGRYDGDEHPNVGIIVGLDSRGNHVSVCTGALIDPTTVLTAAHCVARPALDGVAELGVSFKPRFDQDVNGRTILQPLVNGTPDPDPRWHERPAVGPGGTAAFLAVEGYDIGLLHLSVPASSRFPGIRPAPVTGPGTNDRYGSRPSTNELVTQVGYGVEALGRGMGPGGYLVDFTRNQSRITPTRVTDALLLLGPDATGQAGSGSPCLGDSGSPVFRDGSIISLYVFAAGDCNGEGGGPRLDAGPARDFLRSRGLVP